MKVALGHRKGKRGRGAAGKVPVFRILKSGGKVYTQVLPNIKSDTLISIIKRQVSLDSIVYTDTFQSYEKLDVSGFKHLRINHSKKFADKKTHINGVENFWNQAKRDLRKFNGIKNPLSAPKSEKKLFSIGISLFPTFTSSSRNLFSFDIR